MNVLALDTRAGYMVKCRSCGWRELPTKEKRPGHNWTFSGTPECPTFAPSMNETRDPACCHFTVKDGVVEYHGGTTHELLGQKLPLEPWPDEEVRYYALLKDTEKW